ncbi:MAG: 23S rRNA (pseudouridine(1915)-N(3))-methyltransferase RlmH [Alphaproteobacteria bacterium]
MIKIDVICVAKVKKGSFFDLIEEYKKRIQWNTTIIELESKFSDPKKCQEDEAGKILKHIDSRAIVVAMDERGKAMKSMAFSEKIATYRDNGENHIQFIIGGADGLTPQIRERANLLLSFGQQTWPHLLARVMLLEQIYRAQQILAGHPYHRE